MSNLNKRDKEIITATALLLEQQRLVGLLEAAQSNLAATDDPDDITRIEQEVYAIAAAVANLMEQVR